MEKLFHLKENGSTVKTEMLAGLTTFMCTPLCKITSTGEIEQRFRLN